MKHFNEINSFNNRFTNWFKNNFTKEDYYNQEKYHTVLINQYFFFLFIIFFLHSLSFIAYIVISWYSVLFLSISIIFAFFVLLKKINRNKFFLTLLSVFLCFIITFFSSYAGLNSGVILFYFPSILALAFFFDLKKDWKIVCFLMLLNVGFFLYSAYTDFTLVPKSKYLKLENDKAMFMINTIFSIATLILNYFFIEKKKREFDEIFETNINKQEEINTLKEKVNQLKSISEIKITDESLNDIIHSAEVNDVLFMEKFQNSFPGFVGSLIELSENSLNTSDLQICALMKLNFNTKQIAISTNSTLKSIESKKYRIRKKLNIPSDLEITLWFITHNYL